LYKSCSSNSSNKERGAIIVKQDRAWFENFPRLIPDINLKFLANLDWKQLFINLYYGACVECGNMLASYYPLIGDHLCIFCRNLRKYETVNKKGIFKFGLSPHDLEEFKLPFLKCGNEILYLMSDCVEFAKRKKEIQGDCSSNDNTTKETNFTRYNSDDEFVDSEEDDDDDYVDSD